MQPNQRSHYYRSIYLSWHRFQFRPLARLNCVCLGHGDKSLSIHTTVIRGVGLQDNDNDRNEGGPPFTRHSKTTFREGTLGHTHSVLGLVTGHVHI